ncbi:MAG: UrcA family protein [Woeseiaceae bacterium]
MKESKVLRGVVAAIFISSMPAVVVANGGSEIIGKSEKVSYADLNVEKEAGAKQLYRRLQQASKRVCGVDSLTVVGSLRELKRAKTCYKSSLDSAVAEIDSEALTEIHQG